jgi:hypothetical protein
MSQPYLDVFISYSTKDRQWAEAACALLEREEVKCWIAPRDIVAGTEWGAAIIQGIDACRILVLIFSTNANESPQVRREVERAISKGLTVIPLRVEDVKPAGAMEYALSNTHWLDAFTPPIEQKMNRLVETVKALLAGLTMPTEPPQRTPRAVLCYACDSVAQRSCTLCGRFFCDKHGGRRNIWLDESGGVDGPRNNLTTRLLCDACTPDQEATKKKLNRSNRIVLFIFGAVLLMMLLPCLFVAIVFGWIFWR